MVSAERGIHLLKTTGIGGAARARPRVNKTARGLDQRLPRFFALRAEAALRGVLGLSDVASIFHERIETHDLKIC
jgi:hypothetical protein